MGSREYHAQKSREWYARMTPEEYEERKQYRTKKRQEKKSQFVVEFGSKCSDCGGVFPDPVFEFHHVSNDTKKDTPAKLFMLSDERIRDELRHCIMLCANCHRIRHHEDKYSHKRKKYA